MYEKLFFWLLGFNKKYYSTYKIVASSRNRNKKIWYFNNLYFPVLVILFPLVFKFISVYFETLVFEKSVITILLSGSISLLGINILRSSLTQNSEKLKYENIPAELSSKISEFDQEITVLKKRLIGFSSLLSFVGSSLYFIQIAQLVNDKNNYVYIVLIVVIIIFLLSLFLGRFITLMESNLLEEENIIKLLFSKLITKTSDFENLESQLQKQGL